MLTKKEQRLRRARQTRIRIATQGVARLTVNRTNLHIYASVISGDGNKVLASASTAEADVRKSLGGSGKGSNVAAAQLIGKRVAEKARAAVIQEAYVQGVSTRSVDDLVKAMGMSGISRSQVSRLCEEIDWTCPLGVEGLLTNPEHSRRAVWPRGEPGVGSRPSSRRQRSSGCWTAARG